MNENDMLYVKASGFGGVMGMNEWKTKCDGNQVATSEFSYSPELAT
jgi:hypothetical protein